MLSAILLFVVILPKAHTATLDPIVITASRQTGLFNLPPLETPGSFSNNTRALLDNQLSRNITDVIKNDASAAENYSPLGYYESLSIRGFTLDNATGYKRDGLTIANESSMPLENKESVQILRGPAGFETGFSAPGGVINYVVKRPRPIIEFDYSVSERGTRYSHADIGGRFFSDHFGYRFNVAREDYHPYVAEAIGFRNFASLFLDYRITDHALLEIDGDIQRKSQLSVPGYQSLGGALPPNVKPETMLNNQPWSSPVVISANNIGGSFKYFLDADNGFSLSVNRNHLKSDDVAAFPFGCSSGPSYVTTFCANGDYDLYDYRSLGELRTVTHSQALGFTSFETGPVAHRATMGLSQFNRRVDLGQYIYDYVGTDNIYRSSQLTVAPSANTPGPVHLNQWYQERAVLLRDVISWNKWQIIPGVRFSNLTDDHYKLATGEAVSHSASNIALPEAAVMYSPRTNVTTYFSYNQGIELGGTAPATANNAGEILPLKRSEQFEVGIKHNLTEQMLVTVAAFDIRKPYEFTDLNNVYVRQGRVRHSGLEFSSTGQATENLKLTGSLTLINARQQGSANSTYGGLAPVNVPFFRSQINGDYSVAPIPGLGFDGTWAYVSARYANTSDTLIVPAYHRFDLGMRYAKKFTSVTMTWRLRVENLLDTIYWKDAGQYLGDSYLHLGAPRLFKLSLQLQI